VDRGSFFSGRKLLLGSALLIAASIGSHLYVGREGAAYQGPLLALDHVFDLSLTLALLALCAGVGRHVLKRCGVTFDQPIETLSLSMAFGAGVVATSILLCGLVSGLKAPVLGILLLCFAFLVREELGALPFLCSQSWQALRIRGGVMGLSVLGVVGLFMVSQAMAPPTDWDSLMYHLRVPAQFLRAGRVFLPEDDLHVPFVGLVHMLYVPLMALGSTAGPALISAFIALMLGVAVSGFCLRFFDGHTANLSLSVLWGSPVLLLTAITPRLDVTLAWYLFLAQYALIMALAAASRRVYFYISAVLLGLAVGVKYLSLAYLAALSPLILWVAWTRARSLGSSIRALFAFAILFMVGALPWLAKNWFLFGAPLYPLLAERRMASWLAVIYGSQSIPRMVDPRIFSMFSRMTAPFSVSGLLFTPGHLTVEGEGAFYSFNWILLALPLWILFAGNRILSWLLIPSIGYCVVVMLSRPNLRYLIPGLAPLTIIVAYIVVRLITRVCAVRLVPALLLLFTTLTLASSGTIVYLWTFDGKIVRYLVGASSREEYLSHSAAAYTVASFVNQHLATNSRILMIFEGRGYYFDRQVIEDNDATNWPLLAPKMARGDCSHPAGISHLLINSGVVGYYEYRGLDPHLLQLPSLGEFIKRCTTPLYEQDGLVLYRLGR
jgi:hypothetical protein